MVGCYDTAVYGVGMFDVGSATIDVPVPPGPIVAAYIEWVGVEDTTPGGDVLDGTSQLTINGVTVDGVLAAPFTLDGNGKPVGNAGYDPRAFASAGPDGWFAWHASIGPSGPYGIIPAQPGGATVTLDISGWTSAAKQTNGATISLVFSTGDCEVENEIRFLAGVNWYHHHTSNQEFSELLIYPVEPADHARAARMYFSHAGTDKTQTACRGGAVWMAADDGTQPMPTDPSAFDLLAVGDNDGDGVARGYGINGGVEILNDPFTSGDLPCTPDIAPVPDEPYAPGHPYPNGVLDAPFRVLSIDPATGGDVGAPGEWGVIEATILLPPNARWVAFQLESEPDQNGESGSWVGGGVFLIEPHATLGDRAWNDLNGNGRQDAGEPGIPGVKVTLLDENSAAISTTVTSAAGLYKFTHLPGGAYSLHFATPSGMTPTRRDAVTGANGDAVDSDIDPATGLTIPTELARQEVDLTWDAGFVRPAAVGDFVWLDRNANGLQDAGEAGVAGVTVTLTGAGADNAFDTADDLVRTTTTSAATGSTAPGVYGFDGLPPGRYAVHFALPAGYLFTQLQAGDDGIDSDADPASGATRVVTLRSGDVFLNLDAGLVAAPANIVVEKTPDLQQVGYGEDAAFTISVYNPGPWALHSVDVTDVQAPGCAAFIGDLAVDERVTYACTQAAVRMDMVNVALATGVDIFDRTVEADDDAKVDVLPAIRLEKEANPTAVIEAGGLVTFTVRVRNMTEEPVTLVSLVDDVHGDLNGQGNCLVPQQLPSGAVYTCAFQTFVIPGPDGEIDTIVAIARDDEGNEAQAEDTATVQPKEKVPGTAGLGDFVWYDANADGVQDIDERGVSGVRVLLYRADGTLVAETTTDDDGIYGFAALDAGQYYLGFTLGTDLGAFTAFSPEKQGDAHLDSDVKLASVSRDPLLGYTDIITLPADTVDNSWDAGLTVPTAIEGMEPTAIELVRFAATPAHDRITLLWETSAEQDTNGFHLYRSTNVQRSKAVRMTPQMVPAQAPAAASTRWRTPRSCAASPIITGWWKWRTA
ncbi:MAG: SdrD B-like domain-containing protein [Caldilineaceae bacterium]